jgi:transposase InsO family protein
MTTTMPKTTQEEKYRWIKPILEKEITIKDMVKVCPFSERSLKYWLANYRKHGPDGLRNKSTKPKTQPNETPIWIKEEVVSLRKDTYLCAQKLHWKLKKQGISIHPRTIGKILKQEGLVRKYRYRKQRPVVSTTKLLPGALIEIDVKFVPDKVEHKQMYQFTAIDCATRWRFIRVYDSQSTYIAMRFLKELKHTFNYEVKAIKTDNAGIFTNRCHSFFRGSAKSEITPHQFDVACEKLGIIHYLIDPGKPSQNGKVERSHRTDQEHFYDRVSYKTLEELRYKIKLWNMYYNDLEHCSLNGLTPNQALSLKVQNVRT